MRINFWCCGVRLPVHNQGVDGILAGHTVQHWQLPMLAVFDGMGGESYGEMAASAAVWGRSGGFYEETKRPCASLTGACENMNEAVCRYSNENGIRSDGNNHGTFVFQRKGDLCKPATLGIAVSTVISLGVPADFHTM